MASKWEDLRRALRGNNKVSPISNNLKRKESVAEIKSKKDEDFRKFEEDIEMARKAREESWKAQHDHEEDNYAKPFDDISGKNQARQAEVTSEDLIYETPQVKKDPNYEEVETVYETPVEQTYDNVVNPFPQNLDIKGVSGESSTDGDSFFNPLYDEVNKGTEGSEYDYADVSNLRKGKIDLGNIGGDSNTDDYEVPVNLSEGYSSLGDEHEIYESVYAMPKGRGAEPIYEVPLGDDFLDSGYDEPKAVSENYYSEPKADARYDTPQNYDMDQNLEEDGVVLDTYSEVNKNRAPELPLRNNYNEYPYQKEANEEARKAYDKISRQREISREDFSGKNPIYEGIYDRLGIDNKTSKTTKNDGVYDSLNDLTRVSDNGDRKNSEEMVDFLEKFREVAKQDATRKNPEGLGVFAQKNDEKEYSYATIEQQEKEGDGNVLYEELSGSDSTFVAKKGEPTQSQNPSWMTPGNLDTAQVSLNSTGGKSIGDEIKIFNEKSQVDGLTWDEDGRDETATVTLPDLGDDGKDYKGKDGYDGKDSEALYEVVDPQETDRQESSKTFVERNHSPKRKGSFVERLSKKQRSGENDGRY